MLEFDKKNILAGTRFIALDFETSDYKTNSACAIGMIKIEDGLITDSFYSLIKPPSPRIYFTEVHGLTWPMLKDSLNFSQQWNDINRFMLGADAIIAHNANFDRKILQGTLNHYQLQTVDLPFFCTLKGARQNLGLKQNRLSDVCAFLNIELNHHNALSDADAAANIFLYLANNGYDVYKSMLT